MANKFFISIAINCGLSIKLTLENRLQHTSTSETSILSQKPAFSVTIFRGAYANRELINSR